VHLIPGHTREHKLFTKYNVTCGNSMCSDCFGGIVVPALSIGIGMVAVQTQLHCLCACLSTALSYLRFGLLKEDLKVTQVGMRSWKRTSCWTRGVAVAVRAMRGTSGNTCRRAGNGGRVLWMAFLHQLRGCSITTYHFALCGAMVDSAIKLAVTGHTAEAALMPPPHCSPTHLPP
jgi:hypothetical protein